MCIQKNKKETTIKKTYTKEKVGYAFRRMVAFALALILVFSNFSEKGYKSLGKTFLNCISMMSVQAAEMDLVTPQLQEEDGVYWYNISSASELYWFANKVNDSSLTKEERVSLNARLTKDIVVNQNVLVNGALNSDTSSFVEWEPIGISTSACFAGTFDGQGHSISGLYMSGDTSYSYGGMFGYATGKTVSGKYYKATIKNVSVKDTYFKGGSQHLGGLLGIGCPVDISGCSFSGYLVGTGSVIGGLVGTNNSSNTNNNSNTIRGTIYNCYVDATIAGKIGAGGLVGQNNGILQKCYVTGNISGMATSGIYGGIGGLVGSNGGNYVSLNSPVGVCIECYSTAAISAVGDGDAIGSLAGRASGGYFVNCYGSGYKVKGIGDIPSTGTDENTGMTKNNYYYTETDSEGNVIGSYRDIAINCYYLGETDSASTYNGVQIRTEETFASGKVAYELNHSFSNKEVYQRFGMTLEGVYGQKIGTDKTPVFLTENKENEVFQITYYGEYEGIDYVNDKAVLPECSESGFYYTFTSDATGETFTGNGITSSQKVKVEKESKEPQMNDEGVFEIKCPEHLQWFIWYVNGEVTLASQDDPTCADAVLLADLDMSGYEISPIGSYDADLDSQKERYEKAYKGTFDGRYHTISNLDYQSDFDYVAFFGAAYGAEIKRVGLLNANYQGRAYVAGLVGKGAGVRLTNCYYQGKLAANGDFFGGLVGYADIIEEGDGSNYPSKSLGTLMYRSYAAADMVNGKANAWSGGITGGVRSLSAEMQAQENAQVKWEDCYYDSTRAQVEGAIKKGNDTAYDDVEARTVGRTTSQFAKGQVAWELQQGSMMAGDTGNMPTEYQAVKSAIVNNPSDSAVVYKEYNGFTIVTYLKNYLIWAQNVSNGTKTAYPEFAEFYSDTQKAKVQVYRYGAINVDHFYQNEEETYEFFGNAGVKLNIPQGYPVYPQETNEPKYFVGWVTLSSDTEGKTLVTEPVTVSCDTYLYAFYDDTGRLSVTTDSKDCTLAYGRTYSTEDAIKVTGICTMYPAGTGVSYQWMEADNEEGENGRELENETGNCYIPPINLPVGNHYFYCRVSTDNGLQADSAVITVTITPGTLEAEDFASIGVQYYTGKSVTPDIKIAMEKILLIKNTDFTVSYSNNINVTSGEDKAMAVITAVSSGNYEGVVMLPFDIAYLKADSSMYSIVGEMDEEGYYKDVVQIIPSAGYLMGSRMDSTFRSSGVTFEALHEYDTYTINFYLQQEATGAYTDVVRVQVKVRKTGAFEDTTQEPATTQAPITEDNNTAPPVKNGNNSQSVVPVAEEKPALIPENNQYKDKYGETLFYFDGYDMPKKGSFYNIGNYRYKIITTSEAGGTVQLYKVINKKIKISNIPIYVTINGFHYLVTSVRASAFKGCKKLTKVLGGDNVATIGKKAFYKCPKLKQIVIGQKVKTIKAKAFYGCTKLKTITIRSKKLKKVGTKVFTKIAKNPVITCPKKCYTKYRKLLTAKTGYKNGLKKRK